jgi:ankyrin repeat protein
LSFGLPFVSFSKLLANGCPAHVQPGATPLASPVTESAADKEFRDLAMHGSLERMKEVASSGVNVNAAEAGSGRTPLHKAAYFGHGHVVAYLVTVAGTTIAVQDADGDTALHDAARFGHTKVIEALLKVGLDKGIKNTDGQTALDLAKTNEKKEAVELLEKNCVVM